MSNLYNELPDDEQQADERIFTVGDALLEQFYNGNWSSSLSNMAVNSYTADDLIEYIAHSEESGEDWGGHFDSSFWAQLGYQLHAAEQKLNN